MAHLKRFGPVYIHTSHIIRFPNPITALGIKGGTDKRRMKSFLSLLIPISLVFHLFKMLIWGGSHNLGIDCTSAVSMRICLEMMIVIFAKGKVIFFLTRYIRLYLILH